jgi:ABC-type phosphate/phosphonate transport system substrate-binding protein
MLATLPMYDWPEVRAAVDGLWNVIARHAGVTAPVSHGIPHGDDWRRQDLMFSQTCGYPYTHGFRGRLNYLATPHYRADGCVGADYCSIILARSRQPLAAFADSIAAVNSDDSMSGMLALKAVFAPLAGGGTFFKSARITGAHLESMRCVQQGEADVCAIDAVCVALARFYRPELLQGLVEVGRSPPVPGLPYVNTTGDVVAWRRALAGAFSDPASEPARQALLLEGFSVLPADAYDRILRLEQQVEQAGGLRL